MTLTEYSLDGETDAASRLSLISDWAWGAVGTRMRTGETGAQPPTAKSAKQNQRLNVNPDSSVYMTIGTAPGFCDCRGIWLNQVNVP